MLADSTRVLSGIAPEIPYLPAMSRRGGLLDELLLAVPIIGIVGVAVGVVRPRGMCSFLRQTLDDTPHALHVDLDEFGAEAGRTKVLLDVVLGTFIA